MFCHFIVAECGFFFEKNMDRGNKMNFVSMMFNEKSRGMVILEKIYEKGIASEKVFISEFKTMTKYMLTRLVENDLIKYIKDKNESFYFLCHEGFLLLELTKEDLKLDYESYMKGIRGKLNMLYIKKVKDEIDRINLTSEEKYIFKDIYYDPHFTNYLMSQDYISYNHVDIEPLGILTINGIVYFVVAEELKRNKQAYDQTFKMFKNYLKVLEQENLEIPKGIIILKASGNDRKNKNQISIDHLEFRIIFDSFVDVLTEFKEKLHLLYFSICELEERINIAINKNENLKDVLWEIDYEIGDIYIRTLKVCPIVYDPFIFLPLKVIDYINVYTWNGYQAFEFNNVNYLLLRSEGGDSNSWIKNIQLYKIFSKQNLNTKLICYYSLDIFEPLLNKLEVSQQRSFEASYYDSLYLLDMRNGKRKWKTFWSANPDNIYELILTK